MKRLLLIAVAGAALACGGQTGDAGDAGDAGKGVDGGDATLDAPSDGAPKDAGPDTSLPDSGPITDAGGQPPPPPDAGTATSNVFTFAVNQVFLGETLRDGSPSFSAWETFGYDIDGLSTTSQSTNVCTLATGSPKTNQSDGLNGIDNSWGQVLLPILETATSLPNPSALQDGVIDSGGWTLQIQVAGLSDDAQQSALGLTTALFSSGSYPNGTPAFDSTTDWPVLSTSVNDGQTIASGATVTFASSYVTNGTFVSGPPTTGAITLTFSFGGVTLPITIHAPVVSFDHIAHADAANGTISGVLDTTEFVASMQKVAGSISLSLCGSAFDGIADQIRQAQEILSDGTNSANVACDGISIGLGFTAKLVANPTKVAPAPSPSPDPCGD